MVFVFIDKENLREVLLVKAENVDEIKERLCLNEKYQSAGSLTSSELSTLDVSTFAVVSP